MLAVDAEHFCAVDIPLLVQFAFAVVQADEAAEKLRTEGQIVDGKPSPWLVPWEKVTRALVALSARCACAAAATRRAAGPKPEPSICSVLTI